MFYLNFMEAHLIMKYANKYPNNIITKKKKSRCTILIFIIKMYNVKSI